MQFAQRVSKDFSKTRTARSKTEECMTNRNGSIEHIVSAE